MLTWYRDDKRDNTRTEFLCRVITASMEFIHRETTDGVTISSSQAISWMSKCQALASIWKINNDELRIHQACQLYINGFDRLAEEVNIYNRHIYYLYIYVFQCFYNLLCINMSLLYLYIYS